LLVKEADTTKENKPRIEPPKRSVPEEVGNAVTHGVGALAGIAALVLLLIKADTPMKVLAAAIYGSCLVLLFLMSCLYHSFRWGSRVKRLWRRFDYLSIYLLIAGTFTPFWLVYQGDRLGKICCAVFWAAAVFGMTMVAVFGPGRLRALHMTMYIAMGWSGLVFLPGMVRDNLPLFLTTLGGGLLYTLGIIPFALKKKGAHFIWHFFVLFGAALHWFGIYLFLY